jgi:hypothetical protein
MQVIVTIIAAAFAAIIVTKPTAFAADGKLSDWGPFKFGQTTQQVKNLVRTGTETPDAADGEIVYFVTPSVKFINATGSVTARFYKDHAFEFSFSAVNAADGYVPSGNANWTLEQKVNGYCASVFPHVLDVLSGTYGKADEIVRPGELTQHDQTIAKVSVARWWFSDGSRLTAASTFKSSQPSLCTQFVSLRSGKYAKPYIPEILAPSKQ